MTDSHRALLETRSSLVIALEEVAAERARLQELLALYDNKCTKHEAALNRIADLERMLEKAQQQLANALFLGSFSGLVRRAAFRPIIWSFRVGAHFTRALGAAKFSERLAYGARILVQRQYRLFFQLVQRRLSRLILPYEDPLLQMRRQNSISKARPLLPDVCHSASDSAPALPFRQELASYWDRANARTEHNLPCLVVVVPWLMPGGSEVVLFDVLQMLRTSWAISIITVQSADHALRSIFETIVQEIFHIGELMDDQQMFEFVARVVQTRRASALLSSNSTFIYHNIGLLKSLTPNLQTFDLLHNDLPGGHIHSAVAAWPAIDKQIAISDRVAIMLQKLGVPADRIVTIPNGVDTTFFKIPSPEDRRRARHKLGITMDTFAIGFVGRLSVEKRPFAFLDILHRASEDVDVHAIIVGEGPLEDEMRLALKGVPYPATVISRVNRQGMPELYSAMDIIVLPSTIEGMPLVILEAMAMGCPVAVTEVGDVRKIVKHGLNGFIAPIDDYLQLADPIRSLAQDANMRRKMGVLARKSIIAAGLTRTAMLASYARLISADNCPANWS